jgi:hypothetical protein
MRFRRALSALAVTMVTASGLTVVVDVATAPAAEAAVVKKRLVKMTRELKVVREVRVRTMTGRANCPRPSRAYAGP